MKWIDRQRPLIPSAIGSASFSDIRSFMLARSSEYVGDGIYSLRIPDGTIGQRTSELRPFFYIFALVVRHAIWSIGLKNRSGYEVQILQMFS